MHLDLRVWCDNFAERVSERAEPLARTSARMRPIGARFGDARLMHARTLNMCTLSTPLRAYATAFSCALANRWSKA